MKYYPSHHARRKKICIDRRTAEVVLAFMIGFAAGDEMKNLQKFIEQEVEKEKATKKGK